MLAPRPRTRPLWLIPALIVASSFGLVCSSNRPTGQVSPGQPPPPILIERALPEKAEDLVFPPPIERQPREKLSHWSNPRDSADLGVAEPSLDDKRQFSFRGTSFRVVFNQPITRPQADPKQKLPPLVAPGTLRITPTVEGEARWINDRTIEFVAARPFDAETTYEVQVASVQTPSGAALTEPWKAQFKAHPGVTIAGKEIGYFPVPGDQRVVAIHPWDGSTVGRAATFGVVYDQPIDLPLARKLVSIVDGDTDKPIAVIFDHPKGKTYQGVPVDPRFVVLVRPAAPFTPGAKVKLVARHRQDKHGPEHTSDVNIADELAFEQATCEWNWQDDGRDRPCTFEKGKLFTAGREVRLHFNNTIGTPDEKLASHVHVSPAVKNLVVRNEPWENEIVLTGAFDPSTTYDVSAEGLSDVHNDRLATPVRFRVETAPMPASATMADGTLWLDPETTRHFAVTTRNVAKAVIQAWPVPANDAKAFAEALRRVRQRDLPQESAPITIPLDIKVVRDKSVTTQVDLSRHLAAGGTFIATLRAEQLAFGARLMKMPSGSEAGKPLVALMKPGDERSLAVHTRAIPGATLVQVSRLGSGKPVQNALVRLSGDEDAQGLSTDAAGFVVLPYDVRHTQSPFLAVRAADASLDLPLGDEGVTARQVFPDLAGGDDEAPAKGRAFVMTDRGIYRPGSQVFVKAMLRRPDGGRLLPMVGEAVKVHVVGPTGDDVFTQTFTTSDMGSVAANVTIPPDAKVGRHRILLEPPGDKDDTTLAETMVQVAEFEPPRFAVDVDAAANEKNDLRAEVRARYLFGAPMEGATASWTVRRDAAPFPEGPLTAAGLAFRRSPRWYDNDDEKTWSRAGEIALGAKGSGVVLQALEIKPDMGPQRFTLEADVTDASHRHVAGRGSVVIHPAKRYAGVRINGSWFGVGDTVTVDLGVIDTEGKAVTDANVTARLERMEWDYVKRRGPGGAVSWEWTSKRVEAGRCSVQSKAEPARCTLPITHSGSYEVSAEVDGRRGGMASLWAYGSEGEALPAAPERPHALELSSDKPRYEPGETAKVLVRNPYPEATLIATLEQGGLVEKRTMQIKAGAKVLDFALRDEHAPYVHATVTLLPIGAKGRAIADYKIGAVRLPVSMRSAKLELAVHSDKPSYAPGEEASIDLDLKDGKAPAAGAEIALAVVDEGVLRLTDFHAIDPVSALRPGRGLSFRVRDSRADLGELFERSHVPGDGGGVALSTITEARKKFVETALWKPDIRTDGNGHATVRFKLPDNLTQFRMMAVAVDKDGKGAQTENSFLVKKPVMLVPVVPRFALVGDKLEAAAMLHNETEAALNATVHLGARAQSVNVPPGGQARVGFPLEAGARGTLPLVFSVEGENHKTLDEVEAKLRVEEPGIDERPRLDGAFVGMREVALDIPPSVIDRGDTAVSVQVGEHLWPELGARLEYLLGYPHGCVEQTTSSTLPLIAARTILPRIGLATLTDAELKRRIEAGLQRLSTMRTDSGGLAYWPGGDEPNVYGTAYAIRAVLLARAAGVMAPAGMLEGMQDFLAQSMLEGDIGPEVQAAIAQSLAEAKVLQASAADALYDRRDKQSVFGLASLALALSALPEQDDRVKELLDRLEGSFTEQGELKTPPSHDDFYYYGSPERSRAQAAIALSRLRRSSKLLPVLLRGIANDIEGYTTQATAYSLLALSEHLEGTTDEGAKVMVKLDGEEVLPAKDLGFGSKEFRIPVAKLRGKKAKLLLKAEGDRAVGFAIASAWQRGLSSTDSPAASRGAHGPSVFRVYTDPRGGAVDLSKVRAGDMLRVALFVRLPEEVDSDRRGYIAVTDRIPAGFEPVNPELSTVANAPQIDDHHPFADALRYWSPEPSHLELRDDRVNVYFDKVWGDGVAVTYLLRATTPGHFALPAAAAELMYEPDGVGWTEAQEVTIQ